MTGAHTAGPTEQPAPPPPTPPQRPRRSLAWRIGTPVVGVLSGALFVVSAADSGGTDLRPGRYTDLAGLVEAEAADYEEVRQDLEDLEDDVDSLTEEVSDDQVDRTRERGEELLDPAGLEPRSGPGVTITLSDSPDENLDEAVAHDIKVAQLVVHQQDVQAVVNALWAGGASAVTIAGQRVISTTGIKCEGPVVQLQGVPYPQPYVIQAVGDPAALTAAIDADPLVTGYRTDAANPYIEIGWDMETEDHVEAPAYDGLLDLSYAEPIG
ncbi:DUF881 domain-containing protein [Nocardioides bizhenqiangii]|uniref:DUF881 domain-containing protein n=1 Tax=Nocardioides bizhenqiangii TaxID=3095076 RepID=A0ABZ0ZS86_9ACTN|nr:MULTISPECIES: DUF881 domain-containing protein [unclassified Nocardioides]MDZ5619324.1 DUF881 domain-containing protein [Nocardioides sp. HM23]WQQ26654.1 DUF881 domain-containing protein [Nocardioides sp. HM61]